MIRCIAIVGPTASGKTALGVAVAAAFGGEVVSCDSMQIYKYMNIGTAKPTEEEKGGIRHYMLDFLSPLESFSAEAYREGAMAAITDISERGVLPIIVGGTGLYLDTLLRKPAPAVVASSAEYREKILKDINDGADKHSLWQRLAEIDPISAEKIHENNVKRVIRAIEVYETTGKPKSYWDSLTKEQKSELDVKIIALTFHNREALYERIDKRVDLMFDMGLLCEVESLYSLGYLCEPATASSAIGYKELVAYIEGKCTLDEAKERIKLSSRRYAKRQLTWFRHESAAVPLYIDDECGNIRDKEALTAEANRIIKEFLEEQK